MNKTEADDRGRMARKNDDFASAEKMKVCKLLKYLYAQQIQIALRSLIESECNGCLVGHPSQNQHSCLEQLERERSTELYTDAESKVDKQYLNLLFIETCNILWLNYRAIDSDRVLQDFNKHWMNTNYEDLLEMKEQWGDYFVTASTSAAMKLDLLKKRLTDG